ncbi:hypothetical protein K1719_026740 [Acacia pycnantha]|nr:hypothetical protein K1719_026740 [Acacia pycnantha]
MCLWGAGVSRNIALLAKVKILKTGDQWEDLEIPPRFVPIKMERGLLTLLLECLVNMILVQFSPIAFFQCSLSQRVSQQECYIGWWTMGMF